VNDLPRDIRFGCRLLWRSPGFTIVALLTIAIGIGANAAIFSFFDGVFLRRIAYNGGERMVKVSERSPTGTNVGFSTLEYLELEKQTSILEFIAAQNWNSGALTGLENVVEVPDERVRTHFFDVFQINPEQGPQVRLRRVCKIGPFANA
jgi:putative ABC transport system permease protein